MRSHATPSPILFGFLLVSPTRQTHWENVHEALVDIVNHPIAGFLQLLFWTVTIINVNAHYEADGATDAGATTSSREDATLKPIRICV